MIERYEKKQRMVCATGNSAILGEATSVTARKAAFGSRILCTGFRDGACGKPCGSQHNDPYERQAAKAERLIANDAPQEPTIMPP